MGGLEVTDQRDLLQMAGRCVELMAIKCLSSEAQITAFRSMFAHEFMPQATTVRTLTPKTEYRQLIFPFQVVDKRISDDANPIWRNPAFIMPAVLAMASVFESATLTSRNASFSLSFEQTPEALYGTKIIRITPREEFDIARFNIMVVGAAKAYLTSPDFMVFARWALSQHDADSSPSGRHLERSTAQNS